MQGNSGLQRLLNFPRLYDLFQDAIGGNALRRKFIRNHVRAKTGDRVIDIGCGPAQVLPWLPPVEYLGLDVSSACIASAQRTHARKGTFVIGDTRSLWDDPRFREADIVIGLGILIMSMDRGRHIRTEQTYRQLAGSVFKNVNAWIETKAMRIPYVIILLECQK
jgi:SAM-dependent methyltransferase